MNLLPQALMQIVSTLFQIVGYWFIFRKCGVRSFWALVPGAREYHIGVCADKEQEGRILAVLGIVLRVFSYFRLDESDNGFLMFLSLALAMSQLIYRIRILGGLCRVFGRPRRWIVPMLFFEGLTAMYWGLSGDFQPVNLQEKEEAGGKIKVSGVNLEASDEGLAVNIDERAVVDLFKKRYLLRDIHMTIPAGHMVLLLGGSGAGKTTYVNAVTGYEKAKATITLKEKDLYREYGKMKYDIGFVPQQDLMRGNDTVERTLSDAASLRLPADMPAGQKKERVEAALEQFGLGSVRGSLVEKLSGGQRKRLSIAMEFISNPSLFILDEPDSGLDGVVARSIFENLRSIADEGKIVMVITHTPDRVIDLFDDVIVLAKDSNRTGRLAWYGSVEDAYRFFGKNSMEEILLAINQKDEGGEGRAEEYIGKYVDYLIEKAG